MNRDDSRHNLGKFFGQKIQFVGIVDKKNDYQNRVNICLTSVVPIQDESSVINHVWVKVSKDVSERASVGDMVNFKGVVIKYKRKVRFGSQGFLPTTDYGIKQVVDFHLADNIPATMEDTPDVTTETTFADLSEKERLEVKRQKKALYYRQYRAKRKQQINKREAALNDAANQLKQLVEQAQKLMETARKLSNEPDAKITK